MNNEPKKAKVGDEQGFSLRRFQETTSVFARRYREAQREQREQGGATAFPKRARRCKVCEREVHNAVRIVHPRIIERNEQQRGEELVPVRRVYITPDKLIELLRALPVIAGVNGEFAAEVIAHRKECPNLMKEVAPVVVRAVNDEFGMMVAW